MTRQQVWTDARILAALRDHMPTGPITTRTWTAMGYQPSVTYITRRMGSWNEALARAGIQTTDQANLGITAQAVRDAIHKLTDLLGHVPTQREWNAWPEHPCSCRTVMDHMGHPWYKALVHAGLEEAQWKRGHALRSALEHIDPAGFSGKDREILEGIQAGMSFGDVAKNLHLSRNWVRQCALNIVLMTFEPDREDTPQPKGWARS